MIRFLPILLNLSFLLSSVHTVECDNGGYCDKDETCCYSLKGISLCCGYKSGVCCTDGLNCCPFNTICDLAKRKCIRPGLPSFLTKALLFPKQMPPSKKTQEKSHSEAASKIYQEPQMIDLLNGFLEGSDLLKYLPNVSNCAANKTSIYKDLRVAVDDFTKSDMSFEDIADGIQMIGMAIQGLANSTRSCKNLPESFLNVIIYCRKIAADPGRWFKLISEMATKNSIFIMWDLYGLESLIKDTNYREIGRKLGEIFKYIFEVDLASLEGSFHKTEFTIDYNKMIKCAFELVQVSEKTVLIVQDLIIHPENIFSALVKLSAFFNELETNCEGVFYFKIIANFVKKFKNTDNLLMKKVEKIPSIINIISCIKTIKPFSTDIYNSVISIETGDINTAIQALEQDTVNAAKLELICYKVIRDLISD